MSNLGVLHSPSSQSDPQTPLRGLFLAPDRHPPDRVDVSILFFQEIASHGQRIDYLLQSATPETRHRIIPLDQDAGRVFLAPTNPGTSFFSRLHKRLLDLRNDLRVFGLARKNRYDYIQVRDKFLSGLAGLLAARLTRTRFFFWMSYPMPDDDLEKVRQGGARYPLLYAIRGRFNGFLLYKVLLPAADHAFVQSEQMKRDLAVKGIDPAKMTPVPMGVADEAIPANPGQEEMDPDCVAYLGSLSRVRRMDMVIRAMAELVRRRPGTRLLLIGEGDVPEDRRYLEDLARDLGISEHCEFTGFLPLEQAWAKVRSASVCLSPFSPLPLLLSTSPTKLVEYMALARPVVATDHPEQRLVLEQSGAGLCTPFEPEPFARAVQTLLDDPDRAREMGRKGREWMLENRVYSRIADRLQQVYEQQCRTESARGKA